MLNETDIEAFADDIDAADRAVERVKRGVPPCREMSASEVIPILRAYWIMRQGAIAGAAYIADKTEQEMQSMALGEPKRSA